MSQLAQKLIAENKRTKSPFLDLERCELTELSNEKLLYQKFVHF